MTFRILDTNPKGSMLVIALIIAAVIFAGGATAYVATDGFGTNKDDSDSQSKTSQQTKNNTDQDKMAPATTTGEVKTLFAGAKAGDYDVKCVFDDGTNTGTVYVSGASKMRFDTQTSENGMGHVLRLDKTVYTWAEGQSAGSKLTVSETNSEASDKYSTDEYADNADKYSLSCENAGRLDSSIFTVPSGVTFTDISQYAN